MVMISMGNSMGGWEAHIAIKQSNTSLIKELLMNGKLNANLIFRKDSLLATAIHENQIDIVKLLLEYGADPNLKSYENGRNETPIITATRLNNLRAVQLLLIHGARAEIGNFYGEDAIFRAVYENSFQILQYFLLNINTEKHSHNNNSSPPLRSGSDHHRRSLTTTSSDPSPTTTAAAATSSSSSSSACHSGSKKHCPLILAIKDAPVYPLKKRCLLLLLKYNYSCCCLTPECSIFSEIYECEFYYKTYETDPDILRWIYLAKGLRVYYMHRRRLKNVDTINNVVELPLNLMNLSRIVIRNTITSFALKNRSNFTLNLLKLPLPKKLLDFLLMNDLVC